jgi:hypothetical protein
MTKKRPPVEAKWYYHLSFDGLVRDDDILRQIADAGDFSIIRPLCRPQNPIASA